MPARVTVVGAAARSITLSSRPKPKHTQTSWSLSSIGTRKYVQTAGVQMRRGYSDDSKTKRPVTGDGPAKGQREVLGHVSEEAVDVGKAMGETVPDVSTGVPVKEILERDKDGKKNAPEVIKEEMDTTKSKFTISREAQPLSTASTPSEVPIEESQSQQTGLRIVPPNSHRDFLSGGDEEITPDVRNLMAIGQMEAIARRKEMRDEAMSRRKFPLPELPLPGNLNMKRRNEPIIDQLTNLMMQHGMKAAAQRNMAYILNYLRTAPPPVVSSARPLLPGSPSPSTLPLNPILYVQLAIDSIAPLLRIRSQKGAAGGGISLQIPVPLGLRQRRRTAIQWIIDAASKKQSRGSGKMGFAQRVADEIVAVAEGRSSAWEKRVGVHKMGTAARINLNYKRR